MPAAARDAALMRKEAQGSRFWSVVLCLYLAYVFVTGGSSQERGWADAIGQLIGLAILTVSAWQLSCLARSRVRAAGLIALAIVLLLPWMQLLRLSEHLWVLPPARDELARHLVTVGVMTPTTTWSLTPHATLRAALSMIPAAALYTAALAVDRDTQRRLLVMCVILPLASLILAFLQLGAPQDSLLNPYPQWAPAMNGTFANPNHQGTAMLVGLGICLAFSIGAFGSRDGDDGVWRNPWPAVISGGFLLLCLPLTSSRAAVVIGVLMLVAAPLGMAATSLRRPGQDRRSLVPLLIAAALAALGLGAATGWMKVDELEEVRWIIRNATMALAEKHMPLGSGLGSFVPVFQQVLPESLVMHSYINAAHNDFVQVWLEAGIALLLAVVAVVTAVCLALLGHIREGFGDRRLIWAAMLGWFALIAHSGADYPLRTPTLLAIGALLAGILVSQGTPSRGGWRT